MCLCRLKEFRGGREGLIGEGVGCRSRVSGWRGNRKVPEGERGVENKK